jgi:hypothetical protein
LQEHANIELLYWRHLGFGKFVFKWKPKYTKLSEHFQFVFIQEVPVKRDLLPPYVFNLCRNISYEKSGGNSGIVVIQVEHKMSQFQDVSIGAGTAYCQHRTIILGAFGIWKVRIEMENQIHQTVRTFAKSTRKIVERGTIDTRYP